MNFNALYNQGEALYIQKRDQHAFAVFAAAYQFTNDSVDKSDCLNYMGCCCIALQDYDQALHHFDQATELSPGWERLYFNKGRIYRDTGKMEEALACFRKAVDLNPDNEDAWFYLGTYFKKIGSFDKAIFCYKKSLELNAEEPEPHNELGRLYWGSGELNKALVKFQQAIAIDPDYSEALWNKGQVLIELHRVDEAVICFEKYVEGNPIDTEAMLELARLYYYKRKNSSKAYDLVQRVLELEPTNPLEGLEFLSSR